MGTRALISINGKPMLATHWDGYPSSLGLDLLSCDKSLGAVIRVAESHTIDAADSSLREGLNLKRIKDLSEKHRLTEKEILEGKRRGAVIVAEDYEIGDIKEYGDWAEYENDIRGEVVYFRAFRGPYPESLENPEAFKILTQDKAIESSER